MKVLIQYKHRQPGSGKHEEVLECKSFDRPKKTRPFYEFKLKSSVLAVPKQEVLKLTVLS